MGGLAIFGGLLADDLTGVGVLDDLAILFILGGTTVAGNTYVVIQDEKAQSLTLTLAEDFASWIPSTTTVPNIQGFQYALRTSRDGYYLVLSRGSSKPTGAVYFHAGEIWKIGESTKRDRYSSTYLTTMGLTMSPEFFGSVSEIKAVEKAKIVTYYLGNGALPPGNKIFR